MKLNNRDVSGGRPRAYYDEPDPRLGTYVVLVMFFSHVCAFILGALAAGW